MSVKKLLILLPAFLFCLSCSNTEKFKRDESFDKPYIERDYIGEEKFIVVDGVKTCYVDSGVEDGETLVFLHGLSLSIHNMRLNYPRFFDQYRVVIFDFPGFGKSEFTNESYDMKYFSEFLLSFMDCLEIGKAVLIGNSLGSHVAIQVALDYPDRFNAIVIESSTGIRKRYGIVEDLLINIFVTEKFFYNLSEKKMRKHIETSWYKVSPCSEELVQHRISYRRKYFGTDVYRNNNTAFYRGLIHVIRDSVRGIARDIKVPTLIVWGRYDAVTKLDDAFYLHKKIKGSKLEIIENAGHLAHIEQPDVFNRIVEDYLEEIFISDND